MRTLVAVCAVILALASCGEAEQAQPTPDPAATATPTAPSPTPTPSPSPAPTPEPTPTPAETTASTPGAADVTVFYIRSAPDGLWVEPETRQLDEPTVAVARAAMEELFTGDPREPGLSRPVPDSVEVLGVALEEGLLTVDVSATIREQSGGAAAEEALRQAIAHTATSFETVDQLQLLVGGEPVTDLWGHLDWSRPFDADPFALSPIDITEPPPGNAQQPGPVTAAGTSNTFEATVELRLVAPDGTVAEETFTTATCGSGCRGTWEHTFDAQADAQGTWTITATEPDPSGGEGGPPFETSREFEVTG